MKKNYSFLALVILVTLLASLVKTPNISASNASSAKLHPLLAETLHSTQIVDVIVQKINASASVESVVMGLGGEITQDLSIINAFSARMSAASLAQLSQHSDVKWISPDGPLQTSAFGSDGINIANLQNAYVKAVKADQVWAKGLTGRGIGIAVIDSGITPETDLSDPVNGYIFRVPAAVRFNDRNDFPNNLVNDDFGHGTHIAEIIAGNGSRSSGGHIGIAPESNVINVKVSNNDGSAKASSVVAGMQWVLQNKDTYNIKVVNMSLNSAVPESYHTSPLAAAAEILWFNKIVVVVSAGNVANGKLYSPANDPFVITVGAVDDKGTASTSDDTIASFSAYGTMDGFSKPDLVAPGVKIIAPRATRDNVLLLTHPKSAIDDQFSRMSGTSMAAPIVAAAAALLLQDEPNLTPDQVKYRLKSTAHPFDTSTRAGAGYVDILAAVNGISTKSANKYQPISKLLSTGTSPVNSSVSWNSVSWNSVSWNSVSWNSVSWNSVSWNSTYWGDID